MKTNILNPGNDRNFPYWPGLPVQQEQGIAGNQIQGEIQDIAINKDRYALPYTINNINAIMFPEALQSKKASVELLPDQVVMGRGAGIGLTDMLLTSIAQQKAQTA